jgi:hypothetical protein
MIHGRGKQKKLDKDWQEKRNRILRNPYGYTAAEREYYDVELTDGTPSKIESGVKIKPTNISKRKGKQQKKKRINLEDYPRYGY